MQFNINDDSNLDNSIKLNNFKKNADNCDGGIEIKMLEKIVYHYEKLYMETRASRKHWFQG